MTTISEPFTVMTVSHEAATFGDVCVQPGPTATSAVVTQDSMSASLIEIGDDRAVKTRTWHTKLTLPFTCPVVYDSTRDRYVGVSRKSVFFLSPEEDGGAKRKAVQLPQVVSRILPREQREPVVFYRDGTFSTVTAASNGDAPSGEAVVAGEHIVHVEIADDIVLLVSRLGDSHRCKVLSLNEGSTLLNESLDPLLTSRELRACCLTSGKPLVLTSDGVFTVVSKDGVLEEVGRLWEKICGAAVTTMSALDSQRVLIVTKDEVLVWNLTLQTREVGRSVKAQQGKMAGKALYFLSADLKLWCAPMTVGSTRLCSVVGLGAAVEGGGDDDEDLEEVSEERLVARVRRLLGGKSREALDDVLRLPYSGDRLRSCLRRSVSLDEARTLVAHLLSSLESYSLADSVPLEKILDWLCCVLDAHLPRLLLTDGREVVDLAVRVREATDQVRNLFADLDQVERCLLLRRTGSLRFDSTSLYSIQTMEI